MRTSIVVVALSLIACGGGALPSSSAPRAAPAPVAAAPVLDAPWRRSISDAEGHEPPRVNGPATLLRGGKILLGDGRTIASGHVLIEGGLIREVGEGDGQAPAGARVIDVRGKVVTPGLIDTHSHLGVFSSPQTIANDDTNEMTAAVTAGLRTVDAIWPQDPGLERALAGGVTTLQVLPGSANLIGGRATTLKNRPATSSREMHFAGARDGLKMACGKNPKRVHGQKGRAPSTRMGNIEGQRSAFLAARRLIEEWDAWRREEGRRVERDREPCAEGDAKCLKERRDRAEPKLPPKRDLALETLAGALEGKILVHVHCYRADDMASMMALADEVGLTIRSFHHALEAYKIRNVLANKAIAVSTWADWWGFKMEALDGIPENIALVEESGGRAIVHSDSEEGIRRLNQEAGKALAAARNAGIQVDEGRAIRWLTENPAWALGVEDRVGTLAVGKDADVVVWSASPFSVYARAELVLVDGIERWNAATSPGHRRSDFEVQP